MSNGKNSGPPQLFNRVSQTDKAILLAGLRGLLATMPDFRTFTPASIEHHAWHAQAHALIKRWNQGEAITFRNALTFITTIVMRDDSIATIVGTLHRAIADLELDAPKDGDRAFGPGAVYDFFKALGDLVASSTKSLLVIDPYLDAEIFDYLTRAAPGVQVRLLGRKHGPLLEAARERFGRQTGMGVEIRLSQDFHDRVIFVDRSACWVLGQSIKDAAKIKPTYMAPLDSDIAQAKLSWYENIWQDARVL